MALIARSLGDYLPAAYNSLELIRWEERGWEQCWVKNLLGRSCSQGLTVLIFSCPLLHLPPPKNPKKGQATLNCHVSSCFDYSFIYQISTLPLCSGRGECRSHKKEGCSLPPPLEKQNCTVSKRPQKKSEDEISLRKARVSCVCQR